MFIVLACLPALLRAQRPASVRFDNLGIEAGLSQSTISCMLQDHLGFMWISTEDGVDQYDGYHFKIFRNEPGNAHSIANNEVFAIFEDKKNRLWFVSANGLSRYDAATETFDRVLYLPGIIKHHDPIRTISWNGETLFMDAGMLYRVNGETGAVAQQSLSRNGSNPYLLALLPDSSLLLRDGANCYTWNPATGRSSAFPVAAAGNNFIAKGAICIDENRLLLYSVNRLIITDRATGALLKQVDFGHREIFGSALFDNSGALWLPSINGAVRLDTATMQYEVYNTHGGDPASIAGDFIKCFYKDRTGVLWIGTNEGGISRVAPDKDKFSGMSQRHDGMPGLYAKSVIRFGEDYRGNIWMATNASGINIYNPRTQAVSEINKATGTPFRTDSYIIGLLVDDSLAWCGHENGVDIVSVRTHRIIAAPLRMANCSIKAIYRDAEGNTWAGGRSGIYRYDKKARSFRPYVLPLPVAYVQDIIEDRRGNIWIGLAPGLVRFHPATGSFTNYSLKYPDLIGSSSTTNAFSVDKNGTLWMGSGERGILRYNADADSFTVWGTAAGLPDNVVYATIADAQNNIWVSTNYGISRFDPVQQRFTSFTVKDGLQSNEFNGGAIFKDHNGRLYFGNVAGFNSIDPAHIGIDTAAPRPQITAFRVFDHEIPFRQQLLQKKNIELAQSQNYFSIEYAALDYTNPSENKYRIMLEGFDKDWRPLSAAHSVSYTNLDAGHYTFKVIAYNNDGVASAQVLELPIYVMPPFYKTWWFLLLITLAGVGIVYYFVRLRLVNIQQKAAARLQLSDLDRQMTEYKLQALQAQMNPHFIFNSLNAIQSIIMQQDALKAAAYLADFSKLMRRILDNSHEQFVSLETIVETLRMYVHLEAFRFNNEFSYEFRIEVDLPMHSLKLPPMLLQPYVENAILHGLMPKEGNKTLLIYLFEQDENLHCIIEDNGEGRTEPPRKRDHISRGEILTKGIRDSLNHLLNITATITYNDLKDAAGAALGTRVEIVIPLGEH